MELFEKFFGDLKGQNSLPTLSLFIDDNENGGFFEKATFISDLKAAGKLSPSFVPHTKALIDNMNAKIHFSAEPQEGIENGMKVIWCRFVDGNLRKTLCIPQIKGMAELINSYRHKKIVVSVDFDGLLKQLE